MVVDPVVCELVVVVRGPVDKVVVVDSCFETVELAVFEVMAEVLVPSDEELVCSVWLVDGAVVGLIKLERVGLAVEVGVVVASQGCETSVAPMASPETA